MSMHSVKNSLMDMENMGFFSKLVRNPGDFDKLQSNRLLKIEKEIDAQEFVA